MPYPSAYSEKVILANLLYMGVSDSELAEKVFTHPVDIFADTRNRAVATALKELRGEGHHADVATTLDLLARTGRLDKAGGQQYVVGLANTDLLVDATAQHVDAVVDRWRRNTTDTLIAESQQRLARGEDPSDVTRWLAGMVDSLGAGGIGDEVMIDAGVDEALQLVNDRRSTDTEGLPSGWAELDAHTGGFRPGQLVVVGARPGVGKSVVATGWAAAAAKAGHGVCLFTLEMTRAEVALRMLAAEAWLSFTRLFRGKALSDDPVIAEQLDERLREAAEAASRWPMAIIDRASIDMAEIRRQSAAFKRSRMKAGASNPLSLVVIDYLGLAAPDQGTRFSDRRQFIEHATRECKNMAKDMGCTVVVLAQLNRGAADQSREPAMSDLRESGSYEQDADVILLLRREGMPSEAQEDQRPAASPETTFLHARLAKFRQGEAGNDFTRVWYGQHLTTDEPAGYGVEPPPEEDR